MNNQDQKKKHQSGDGPEHYKNNSEVTETIVLMENVAVNVFQDCGDIKKAMNASYAMKHLNRLGTKKGTDMDDELHKAENYLHRARTGEWIQK